MGGLDNYKPEMAMLGLQFSYAGVALLTRPALVNGMSPRVFIVYRQAIATSVIAPIAIFSRRKAGHQISLGLKSFSLIFSAALIGVTINQNVYFEGLYLASSSMASAMNNLVPAITFILAAIIGLEEIKIRSLRSIAKIAGTVLSVCGAISMALLRGPKLLNTSILGGEFWLLGCLFLFASCCCWSFWLIMQVPVTNSYPDHISLSAWMCFLATVQSAMFTIFLEQDPNSWKLNSFLEVGCCLFAGIIGSALTFFVQAWCISQRGPLFSAIFNPLSTIVVTILAAIFLHEEIYMGSMIGAVAVIMGLYVVLWGKAKDFTKNDDHIDPKLDIDRMQKDQSVEEPLLPEQSKNIDDENSTCQQEV